MCNVSFAARMLAVTLIALMAFIPSCARQSDEVLVQLVARGLLGRGAPVGRELRGLVAVPQRLGRVDDSRSGRLGPLEE